MMPKIWRGVPCRFLASVNRVKVIVNFCSMLFCQPLHMHKLKDDMIGDDKNNG